MRRLPYAAWQEELVRTLEHSKDNALAPFLPLFHDRVNAGEESLTEETFGNRGAPRFDNTNTIALLERGNIRCPPADAALLKTYFSSFAQSGLFSL